MEAITDNGSSPDSQSIPSTNPAERWRQYVLGTRPNFAMYFSGLESDQIEYNRHAEFLRVLGIEIEKIKCEEPIIVKEDSGFILEALSHCSDGKLSSVFYTGRKQDEIGRPAISYSNTVS